MFSLIKSALVITVYVVVVVAGSLMVASYGVRFICDMQHFTQ